MRKTFVAIEERRERIATRARKPRSLQLGPSRSPGSAITLQMGKLRLAEGEVISGIIAAGTNPDLTLI